VLAAATWSVLALTCHIELFVQAYCDESDVPREEICPLFRDVFFDHWKQECQHAMLDKLGWTAEHVQLPAEERVTAEVAELAREAAVFCGICDIHARE